MQDSAVQRQMVLRRLLSVNITSNGIVDCDNNAANTVIGVSVTGQVLIMIFLAYLSCHFGDKSNRRDAAKLLETMDVPWTKTIRGVGRRLSIYWYISFCLWIVYIIISSILSPDDLSYCYYFVGVLAYVSVPALHLCVIVESFYCCEYKLLKSATDKHYVESQLTAIKSANPTILFKVIASHGSGEDTVITAKKKEQFEYSSCADETIIDSIGPGYAKIILNKTVRFADIFTKQRFYNAKETFERVNRNLDTTVTFTIEVEQPGYQHKILMYSGDKPAPWMKPRWFIIASLAGLSWPYRIVFNCCVNKKIQVEILKIVAVQNSDQSVDGDGVQSQTSGEPCNQEAQLDRISQTYSQLLIICQLRQSNPRQHYSPSPSYSDQNSPQPPPYSSQQNHQSSSNQVQHCSQPPPGSLSLRQPYSQPHPNVSDPPPYPSQNISDPPPYQSQNISDPPPYPSQNVSDQSPQGISQLQSYIPRQQVAVSYITLEVLY